MKTTLIYPGIAGYGFDSLGSGMEAGWVSHGLAHLSSAAKAQGFDVDLIDLRALSGWDEFREELLRRRPDVAALTMMSVDYNPASEAASIIRDTLPETVIVVGGPHPTIMVEEVAELPVFDYVITREGEVTFPWLLGELRDGRRPDSRVLEGEVPDLDNLPFSDRELFLDEWRKYGYTLDSQRCPLSLTCRRPF